MTPTDSYPVGTRVLAGDRERTITRREVVCGQVRLWTGSLAWWPSQLRPVPVAPAEIVPMPNRDVNAMLRVGKRTT